MNISKFAFDCDNSMSHYNMLKVWKANCYIDFILAMHIPLALHKRKFGGKH